MKNTKISQSFPVILEGNEKEGYIVTNPAFEGCYSQGDNIEEALKNIKEATELCLEESASKHSKFKPKNISLHLITLNSKYA